MTRFRLIVDTSCGEYADEVAYITAGGCVQVDGGTVELSLPGTDLKARVTLPGEIKGIEAVEEVVEDAIDWPDVALEGPHYPKPHTWYAEGTMKNGRLVRVR